MTTLLHDPPGLEPAGLIPVPEPHLPTRPQRIPPDVKTIDGGQLRLQGEQSRSIWISTRGTERRKCHARVLSGDAVLPDPGSSAQRCQLVRGEGDGWQLKRRAVHPVTGFVRLRVESAGLHRHSDATKLGLVTLKSTVEIRVIQAPVALDDLPDAVAPHPAARTEQHDQQIEQPLRFARRHLTSLVELAPWWN